MFPFYWILSRKKYSIFLTSGDSMKALWMYFASGSILPVGKEEMRCRWSFLPSIRFCAMMLVARSDVILYMSLLSRYRLSGMEKKLAAESLEPMSSIAVTSPSVAENLYSLA